MPAIDAKHAEERGDELVQAYRHAWAPREDEDEAGALAIADILSRYRTKDWPDFLNRAIGFAFSDGSAEYPTVVEADRVEKLTALEKKKGKAR
ncbi:hypothetical protein [Acrocarpospora sp. B8E8]|uniref:hypothetical protein n=1 Tax=Acrocarpospora sp. B8E8 TaxID=3153572 RepID=UPI00325DC61E